MITGHGYHITRSTFFFKPIRPRATTGAAAKAGAALGNDALSFGRLRELSPRHYARQHAGVHAAAPAVSPSGRSPVCLFIPSLPPYHDIAALDRLSAVPAAYDFQPPLTIPPFLRPALLSLP